MADIRPVFLHRPAGWFDTAAIGYIAPSLITEWGVQRPALAPVLSAALFGLAFGALSSGPLADRFGRKKVLVGSVLVMGVACLASAFSAELNHLVVWRFITGLGLWCRNAERRYPDERVLSRWAARDADQRHVLRLSAGCRVRRLSRRLDDPEWGWRSVLVLGGVAPLILTVLLVVLLPESVRYMVARNEPVERIRAVLRRISASPPMRLPSS